VSEQISVSRRRDEPETVFSVRSNQTSGNVAEPHFDVTEETSKTFHTFNTTGRNLLIKLKVLQLIMGGIMFKRIQFFRS
jgi:hypothetical protein